MVLLAALFILAPSVAMAQGSSDALGIAIAEHRLTVALVERTVAVDRDLLALQKKDPSIAKRAEKVNTRGGLDATVKAMEALPEFAKALSANQIGARDYLLTQMALLSTTTMHELLASGRMPALPPGMPTHNLEFWKANVEVLKPLEAEWKSLRAELQKASR